MSGECGPGQMSSSAHPVEIAARVALPVLMIGMVIYWLPVIAGLALGLMLVSPALVIVWVLRR